MTNIATIEIVDFPIDSMVIFHSYVNVYQRVYDLFVSWKLYEPQKHYKTLEFMFF